MVAIQVTLTTTIPAPGFLFDVAFSPDGRWLALATSKRVPVVEIATGRTRLAVRHRPWRGVLGVAFSPDGRWLATCGQWDRAARIWDAATGKQLHRIPHKFVDNPGAGRPKVQAVAFSPDSRWLATGSADCTARIFEVTSGQELLRVTNCPGVNDVAFSPDGRWLAVGGGDTARVWDAHSGRELLVVRDDAEHPASMRDAPMEVAFSADGQLLATSGRAGRRLLDDVVRVWQLQETPMGAPTPPSAPGGAAPARVRERVDLASERSRSVEAPVGAVRVSQRTRRLKERLRAAAVGRLAQGEELLVATYAQHGRPPAMIRWAGGLLTIWCIALPIVRGPLPLVIASLCAYGLLLAYVLISRKWLGVVLTDRRLLLWSTAPVTRQLRGVLLDVPRGQVSMPLPFVVRFDETVGPAPISLSFRGEFAPDGIILHRALASSEA